jgi:hypothetical protein
MTKEEKKIFYADVIARILMVASVTFIAYGSFIRMLQDPAYGNTLMFTGLVFVVLFGVAVYTKKYLQKQVDSGLTFHQRGN